MNEVKLVKEMKKITRMIYSLIVSRSGQLKVNQTNFFDIYVKCDELFESIFKFINLPDVNKSLFLDFMNFELQVNYCFEMMTNHEMTTQEINQLMQKEKDYLDYTFQSITNIDLAEI